MKIFRFAVLALALTFSAGITRAQQSPEQQSQPTHVTNPDRAADRRLAEASEGAGTDEEENAQFKYSKGVRAIAQKTGLSREAVYWLFLIINFVILAAGIVWIIKKVMPNGFAGRTAEIQKGLEEARKASAEANARLTDIEGRLSKLDSEIAEIRATADKDFAEEEQRIKLAADQDAKNVIASAEQEIAAASRAAQRDLKAYAAELAVDLAAKKIKVDAATDQVLVRDFAAQLGKDGQ